MEAEDEPDDGPGILKGLPNVRYVGNYEVIEEIARGGMGVVYLARQRSLNRNVALKMLLGGVHAGKDFKRRFRLEAETAAKLEHPNIVPIHEAGEHDGQPYFSMEYVPGSDLARLVREKPLPSKQAAEYVKTIAEATHYAHLQGVLHRDLKPSNILVGTDGRPRITDFGLARQMDVKSSLTITGTTLGTPGYLAPEQISAKRGRVGTCSDVYSLGAVLYHLLTGRAPFGGDTLADVMSHVLHTRPQSPSGINGEVPKPLAAICLKCLEKEPQNRYGSAADLAQDLDRWLQSEAEGTASNGPQLSMAPRGAWLRPLAYGLFALALVAGVWWFGHQRREISKKPPKKPETIITTQPARTGDPDRFTPTVQRWTNSLRMVFVPVPGTKAYFSIWDTRLKDFEAFVKATNYEVSAGMESLASDGWKQRGDTWRSPGFSQGPAYPVCGVGWHDAKAFCRWLTGKERQEGWLATNAMYRLPTAVEWKAAAGDSRDLWDGAWPPPHGAGNFAGEEAQNENWPTNRPVIVGYRDGYPCTSPVGAFAANRFGLFDLGGNVWQWCEDHEIAHGGSWWDMEPGNLLPDSQWTPLPSGRSSRLGFRCVLVPDEGIESRLPDENPSTPVVQQPPLPPPEPDRTPHSGESWTNSLGMPFVALPSESKWVCRWETRVRDFNAFRTNANAKVLDRPTFLQTSNDPITLVSAQVAEQFCRWLAKVDQSSGRLKTNQSYRLPTVNEWLGLITDAEATNAPPGKGSYLWGDDWPPPPGVGNLPGIELTRSKLSGMRRISGFRDAHVFTAPVNMYGANRMGVADLVGNVWEICTASPPTPFVALGGAWDTADPSQLRLGYRLPITHTLVRENLGFRCLVVQQSEATNTDQRGYLKEK